MLRFSTSRLGFAACLFIFPAAGCTDPASVVPSTPNDPASAVSLECKVDVPARTMRCDGSAPAHAGRRDILVGGQGVYVRLTSTNVSVDSLGYFGADVTVQNLLPQPMGTADGINPTSDGVRVFFAQGPAATSGTGGVRIANADGYDAFTASAQPFFRYPTVLQTGETSQPKRWTFGFDPGVVTFAFTVYVSAPVPFPMGWIDVSPDSVSLNPGETVTISATVRSAVGKTVPGAHVTWASQDTSVARVGDSGTISAVAPGKVLVIATSGPRHGTVTVSVSTFATQDTIPPSLEGFDFSPRAVSTDDTVAITLSVADVGTGVKVISIQFNSLTSGQTVGCNTSEPSAGTRQAGTFLCDMSLPPGAAAGTWQIAFVALTDNTQNQRVVTASELVAAGFPTTFTLEHPATQDTIPPTLVGFDFTPRTVSADDTLAITLSVTDAGTGVKVISIQFNSLNSSHTAGCNTSELSSGTRQAGTFVCEMPFPSGAAAGSWRVGFIALTDNTQNQRVVTGSALAAAGFPTTFELENPASDVTAPSLLGFDLNPRTVSVDDTVAVTLSVTDAGTGVLAISIQFKSLNSSQTVGCNTSELSAGNSQAGTFICNLSFPPGAAAGTWQVAFIALTDNSQNQRVVTASELVVAGFPATFELVYP